MRRCLAALVCVIASANPAAASLTDWSVSQPSLAWSEWTASLGGLAGADAYAASGLPRTAGAGLSALLFPHLDRLLDNGWEIGARGAVLAYHDRLAGDIYGDRTFEKAYLFAQTPYGRFEAGQDDGAAYRLSKTGPSVDEDVSVGDPATTFFRDPSTGRAFIDMFRLQTAVFDSSNDAKFSYISPRWFGIQAGGSYTPNDAHGGLPFISRGDGGADRQTNLLEGAANYAGTVSGISYTAYAALAFAHDAARTAGHNDLLDWSIGGEADTSLDTVKLVFGGSFRESNAYAFDVTDARASGQTSAWRLGATATKGEWIAGFEYADGTADNAWTRPGLREHGTEISLGYVINANLQFTAGWQGLRFRRAMGVFFNDTPSANLSAEFLRLKFHV
jgi:Gram-negative porin